MKKFLMILFALLVALPIYGQQIETRASGQDQIVRVATALNHLTVIQLSDPVLSVAAGSRAFRVEWRGNKVFVEPTEAGVSTNLFIWTKAGRNNYELEPAGSVRVMDFAIDTAAAAQAPDPPSPKPEANATVEDDPEKHAIQVMLGGTPVRQENWKAEKHRVEVMVRDLFERNGTLYIRYSIENETRKAYAPGTPQVVELRGGASQAALIAHAYTQIRPDAVLRLKTHVAAPLAVTASELRSRAVRPGETSVGVIGVRLSGSGPALLLLQFKDAAGHPVSAAVVI